MAAFSFRFPPKPEPPDEGAAADAMQQALRGYYDKLLSQREEVLAAFVAKYGCQPDEVVQIHQYDEAGHRWWVRLGPRAMIDAGGEKES